MLARCVDADRSHTIPGYKELIMQTLMPLSERLLKDEDGKEEDEDDA